MQVKIIVDELDEPARLDRWLKKRYSSVPTTLIHKYIRKKLLNLNGAKANIDSKISSGDEIILYKEFEQAPVSSETPHVQINTKQYKDMAVLLKKNIIYQDEHLLVINKPYGLAVQGGSKISLSVDDLAEELKFGLEKKPKLVHRLDKDTSGILLLARTDYAAQILSRLFKQKQINKIYWAIVAGNPQKSSAVINLPISKKESLGVEKVSVNDEGKNAITEYKVLDNAGQHISWLEMSPITGRTHQLRVHAAAIGTPILGDGKYGGKAAFIKGCSDKLHLHAREVIIKDFFGKDLNFTAELPPHIQQTFDFFEFRERLR